MTTTSAPFIMEGEPLSLDDLCTMEYSRIHSRIYGITNSVEQADDLTQVVFMKVTATARRSTKPILFEHLVHLRAWLNVIAKFTIIDYKRHVALFPELSIEQLGEKQDDHTPYEPVDPIDIEEQACSRIMIDAVLPKIVSRDRDVLVSFYVEGNKYHEVIEELQISRRQFDTSLRRGKEHFKRHFLGIPIAPRTFRRRA